MEITETRQKTFNAGVAFWNQRSKVAAARPRLESFAKAVGASGCMHPSGYAQLFAMVMEFQPDLILEIGRAYGNSTCVFTEAANQLGNARVVSLCLSNAWQTQTREKIKTLVPASWFDKLDARVQNACETDFEKLFAGAKRVFFFWDAHGWEVARHVLGRALPALEKKDHLIVVDDVHDVKGPGAQLAYGNEDLWTGYSGDDKPHPRYVMLGEFRSAFEELIGIIDFATRNDLTLHSVAREINAVLTERPEGCGEVERLLGKEMAQRIPWFIWFQLDRTRTMSYPKLEAAPSSPAPSRTLSPEMAGSVFASDMEKYQIGGKPTWLTYLRIFAKLVAGRYDQFLKKNGGTR